MAVSPGGAARQFVKHFGACLRCCFRGKLVPYVFHKLETFKFPKMLNGGKRAFHGAKFTVHRKNLEKSFGNTTLTEAASGA